MAHGSKQQHPVFINFETNNKQNKEHVRNPLKESRDGKEDNDRSTLTSEYQRSEK